MIRFTDITPPFSGLCAIKQKGKWGFINLLGDFVAPCEYDSIQLPINDDKIAVKKKGKWGYINTKNNITIGFEFDEALAFKDGFAPIKKGKNWGVINERQEFIIPAIYNEIDYLSNQLFVVRKDNKWGFINTDGDIILPFIYDRATAFSFNVAYIRMGQRHGFINYKGEFVLELTKQQRIYLTESISYEALIIVNVKGAYKYDWSIYSNEGNLIMDALRYTRINPFYDGLASVYSYEKHPKWGVINMQGELVVPCEYDDISFFLSDLAFATKGIYSGYIDKQNQVKIPFKYRIASTFNEGFACVSSNRWNTHIIDVNDNIVLSLKKEKSFENALNFCAYRWTDIFNK